MSKQFTEEEDRALLQFVIRYSKEYDQFKLFRKAAELVPILSERNPTSLYRRYHRYLYPMYTGEVSNEIVELHPSLRNDEFFKDKVAEETKRQQLNKCVKQSNEKQFSSLLPFKFRRNANDVPVFRSIPEYRHKFDNNETLSRNDQSDPVEMKCGRKTDYEAAASNSSLFESQ